MENIKKLKLLIAFYLIVLVFLLLCVMAMPLIIRHGLSVANRFVIEEQSLETVLIVLLLGVSFFILRGFNHSLEEYHRHCRRHRRWSAAWA